MKIGNLIFVKYDFEIMEISDSEDKNPLNWSILPIEEKVIPNDGHFLVISKQILENEERTCWIEISMPEMISDHVFTIDAKNSKIVVNEYHALADKVVPNKLSNTLTNYEFYYTRVKPIIGIEILIKEIENVLEKGSICEYLGYIFRDEKDTDESLKWFLKSLEFGEPSSEYIYDEISKLYDEIGEAQLAKKYRDKLV